MTRRSRILTACAMAILAAQALGSYTFTREPFLPAPPPLFTFPGRLDSWQQLKDIALEPEVQQALGPDDSLIRDYQVAGDKRDASLFVAYYKSQLRSRNAHDPKVCLPGAGWNPQESHLVNIPIPNSSKSLSVNYYRIAKSGQEAVVLYWFQTHSGVYAFEQQLKFRRMIDAVVDRRTDMALVRIIVPVGAAGVAGADADANQLAQLIYKQMLPYFPSKEKVGS